ncbi:hypothetical protein HYR69_10590 [Candidatus Sumerlaeota bacterium]|nr:hypothetical protein [Candidatus Sumerlaeota bacterium]
MALANNGDFSSRWKEWLNQIISSKLLTIFEPEKEFIPGVRIGQARYISTQLVKASDDSFIHFPNEYGRHTTLSGVWMFLEKDHKKEYLITAFGQRKGKGVDRPARFDGLHVSHGAKHSVQFSPRNLDYLQKHIDRVINAEVLICHNHPQNIVSDLLSEIIDWNPLPSNTDRDTSYQFKYNALVRWLASGNFQSMRFYLVEAGRLREILLPPADRIVRMLKEIVTWNK